MATKENALAIVLAMVPHLALIYHLFQVPDFARTFAYGAPSPAWPGGGGVDTAYNTARRRLSPAIPRRSGWGHSA
ncbi:hypothetical protein ACOJBO_03815 [Rhizobium beringeri]